MENLIKTMDIALRKTEKEVKLLSERLKTLTDTSYKTSNREVINREVQFLQKVYDKNGGVVSEINS